MKYLILNFLLLFITHSCKQKPASEPKQTAVINIESKTVVLVPLGKISPKTVLDIKIGLQPIFKRVNLQGNTRMPKQAFYAPRNRYRADTLIRWMSRRAKENEVYVGITEQDISTTKGQFADYGVVGLGFQPGKACVVSNFRLKDKRSFYKVVIHELGHTAGLPHCPNMSCFMRDADGGDHTNEEKGFCDKCKLFLQRKGWRL